MLLSVDRSDRIESEPLSLAVIDAVAKREGVDATEIEPPEYEALYDVIDPEALDSLFAIGNGTGSSIGRVEFTFCGYDIVVTSDGEIHLNEGTESTDSENENQ